MCLAVDEIIKIERITNGKSLENIDLRHQILEKFVNLDQPLHELIQKKCILYDIFQGNPFTRFMIYLLLLFFNFYQGMVLKTNQTLATRSKIQ